MRVLVLYDLPSVRISDKRQYRNFRKFLLKSGFIMLQESVYSKLALNSTAANAIIQNLRKNKPASGLVQAMVVTEKQYNKMEYLVGEFYSEVLNTTERLTII